MNSLLENYTATFGVSLAVTLTLTGIYTGFGLVFLFAAGEATLGFLPKLLNAEA